VHQHLFSARLDMSVDGLANAVEEVDVSGLPAGPDNPFGNAIAQTVTRLSTEAAGARSGDAARGRVWRVISTESVNRFGKPVAFTLYPQPNPALLADPDSPLAARAGFATRALWVTRYAHVKHGTGETGVDRSGGAVGGRGSASTATPVPSVDVVCERHFLCPFRPYS
jgi:primary-amine oxidase